MDRHAQRRDKLRRLVRKIEVEALLVTNESNVTYLTGFTGESSYLWVPASGRDILLTDTRYTTQLAEECPGLELIVRDSSQTQLDPVVRVTRKSKIKNLGIESDSMTIGLAAKIIEKLPKVTLVRTEALVEDLRAIKDKWEIDEIRQAIWYAERGFEILRASLRPEQTEREIANQLEFNLRKLGARACSFPPVVGVGPRAALPHGRPSEVRIGESDHVLVDWGAWGRLYRSDLTRVLVTARISPKLQRVYGVVLKAQAAGIAAIRPGIVAKEVDAAARKVIADAGFTRFFGHGLGHGIGLDVHEAPSLRPTSETVLEPGMVITVEPGVYLPGWGGVRIEDDVLVTKDGQEVLSSLPKKFDEMIVQCSP
jgi:Xaa-Pro aminopeptidase